MSFFGLTHLGFENPFSDLIVRQDLICDPDLRPSVLREEPYERIKNHYFYLNEFNFDRQWYWNGSRKPACKRKPPFAIYRLPLTANEEYGWWGRVLRKGELLPPWAFVQRYPAIRSDVIKWADSVLKSDPNMPLF
ncbi:uncharacterized protein [Centruroides vittatus]|uniref:uncharacterized protein n=1 Tax=Centruroides vittatus TaxID=120091 RepID=UPI00350F76DE